MMHGLETIIRRNEEAAAKHQKERAPVEVLRWIKAYIEMRLRELES